MSKQKLTVFQKLNNIFGPTGVQSPRIQTNKYTIGNDAILKTTDKGEYEVAKLQAQQSKYVGGMWRKVDNEMFQKTLHYETTRIGSYSDFETMEFYPEISATLDIMMEESTTTNDKGRVLNVYSNSKRVKTILEDLFFNRLDIHTTLPMWTRNTPIREDSIIPLLDGTEITIKELSNRVKNGEEIWSYAIQDGTKAIVPSKIVWCDLTRKDSELIRVTLDDGTYLDTTPDHEYMLRDGSYKRADELTSGQSLMPFYTTISKESDGRIKGYEKIYNPASNRYRFTHRIVANECVTDYIYENSVKDKFLTHHIDFNKKNNDPSNLVRLTFGDHSLLHEKATKNLEKFRSNPDVVKKRMDGIDKYLRSDERRNRLSKEMKGKYPEYFKEYNNSNLHVEHNEIRSEKMLTNWSSEKFIEKTKKGMTIQISDSCLDYVSNIIINNENYIGINELAGLLKVDIEFIKLFKENYTLRKDIIKSINTTTLNKILFRKTNKNYFDFVLSVKPNLVLDKKYIKAKSIYLGKTKGKVVVNHKVVSVIKLSETSDVYCLEAVGPKGEHDRHNFPVLGKDLNGLCSRSSGVFLSNCKYGDNFVFLNIDDKSGVLGARQLPNFEIERREGDIFGRIMNNSNANEDKDAKVKFLWRGKDIEFNSWQIAHFRLLGDDRRLPYGTSILEKARRIWKQLCVSENTRVCTIDGYKKIKDVKSGDEIYSYDYLNGKIVSTKVKDCWNSGFKKTYNIRSRYTNINVTDEHDVLIYDGTSFSYKKIDSINVGIDKLVIPTINNIGFEKVLQFNNDNYYIKLNDLGLLKVNNIDRVGIVNKLKDINELDYKNIHRFIQGNGKVKYSYIDKLNKHFNINLDDVDVYYNNTKSILTKDLKFKIDNDFGRFIGFMLGDGWLETNGIGFALGVDSDLNDFYIDYISKNLKNKFSLSESKVSEFSKAIHIHNKELKNLFLASGFISGFQNKRIPEWVYSMPLDFKRLFIRGLFDADGSDKYGVISLANKNLITDLKELCLQSGIACGKICKTDGSTKFNNKTGKYEVRQDSYKLYINFNNILDDVRYEKIIDISENEEEPVWDLEVYNELHNFIANGSVVHNCLSEDAMLIYRVTRAPERRVYKIFVGNIDEEDVASYVDDIANRFKRTPITDPRTGQVDLQYNQMSNDQDFFIPVRSEDAPNPIDTLPGASNLSDIADIEYLQRKLFTALRVPKSFLGFDEAVGEGKNLALQDIRFTRTVNRIQQSMIMELNKIAILHLFLLGLEDELDNFTLTLNNPSTQAQMLKIEQMQAKVTLYKDATVDAGNGFAAMSMTRGKREIFEWSDDEIKQDFLEQRVEKAAAAEMENTANVIKHTGTFDEVDRLYGDINVAKAGGSGDAGGDTGGDESGPTGGGGFGGGGFGGGGLDFGDEGGDEGAEEVADEGGDEGLGFGEEGGDEVEATEPENTEESTKDWGNLLTENRINYNKKVNKYKDIYFGKLLNSFKKEDDIILNERVKISNKNIKINESINDMINDIDKMINE